jgi:hypothetical protein
MLALSMAQQGATGYSGQGAPLSAEELQQLVAPIVDKIVKAALKAGKVTGPFSPPNPE